MDKNFKNMSIENAITKIVYVLLKSGKETIIINIKTDDLTKISRTLYGVSDTLKQYKINQSVLNELSNFFNCNIEFSDYILKIEKRA